jgi:hypothetical protein
MILFDHNSPHRCVFFSEDGSLNDTQPHTPKEVTHIRKTIGGMLCGEAKPSSHFKKAFATKIQYPTTKNKEITHINVKCTQ